MLSPVSNSTHPDVANAHASQAQSAAQATAAQKPQEAKPQSTASNVQDTVTVSSAAQAALKEATETAAQTQKEAASGDHQAQRLQAKEQAAEKEER